MDDFRILEDDGSVTVVEFPNSGRNNTFYIETKPTHYGPGVAQLHCLNEADETVIFPVTLVIGVEVQSPYSRIRPNALSFLTNAGERQLLEALKMKSFKHIGDYFTPQLTHYYDELSNSIGRTVKSIEGMREGSEIVRINFTEGPPLFMFGEVTCCEDKNIEDIAGDPEDLIGRPLVICEEVKGDQTIPKDVLDAIAILDGDDFDLIDDMDEDLKNRAERFRGNEHLWTYYRFGTDAGTVVLRWLSTHTSCYASDILILSGGGEALKDAVGNIEVGDVNFSV